MKREQTKRLEEQPRKCCTGKVGSSELMFQAEQALALSRCADALENIAGCVLSGDGEKALAIFRKDEL